MKPHEWPEKPVSVMVIKVEQKPNGAHTHMFLSQCKDNVNGKSMWSLFRLHLLVASFILLCRQDNIVCRMF